MNTIYKYELKLQTNTYQDVAMPAGAVVLTVQAQRGVPVVWAQVDSAIPPIKRRFWLAMTGHPVPMDLGKHYIDTMQFDQGGFIVHAFTDREERPV